MKTIKNYFASLVLLIAMPLSAALAQNTFSSSGSSAIENNASAMIEETVLKDAYLDANTHNNVRPHLNFTLTIPAALQSQIVRVDYENESIFGLKTGDKQPAFLFSVTKVTADQWMKVKNQVKRYTIIENQGGFIIFAEKTDVEKIKGEADAQYQQVLDEVDAMVNSIRVK